jgi:hypothetical protein
LEEECEIFYDTCVVVDICQWSDDMTICTKHRFPEVQLSMVHSTTSLTGFSIVMKIQSPVGGGSRPAHAQSSSSPNHACNAKSLGQEAHAGDNDRNDAYDCKKKRARRSLLCTSLKQSLSQSLPVHAVLWAIRLPTRIVSGICMQRSHIAGVLVCASILLGAYYSTEYIKLRAVMDHNPF